LRRRLIQSCGTLILGYITQEIRNLGWKKVGLFIEFLLNLFRKSGFPCNSIDFTGGMCYNSVTLRSKAFCDQSYLEIDAND